MEDRMFNVFEVCSDVDEVIFKTFENVVHHLAVNGRFGDTSDYPEGNIPRDL